MSARICSTRGVHHRGNGWVVFLIDDNLTSIKFLHSKLFLIDKRMCQGNLNILFLEEILCSGLTNYSCKMPPRGKQKISCGISIYIDGREVLLLCNIYLYD